MNEQARVTERGINMRYAVHNQEYQRELHSTEQPLSSKLKSELTS